MHRPATRRTFGRFAAALLAVAVAGLLLNLPLPARASPTAPAATVVLAPPFYHVTWNGVDVQTSGSASSAQTVDLTQNANLLFTWALNAPAGADVRDARIQMFYFGFAVATRDQVINNPTFTSNGSIPLSWTPLSVSYLLEGVYRLTASFIAANGSTLFSENFYVRDNAPLGVLAILPIVLLVLLVYEVYALVRSGRYALLGEKSMPSTPPTAPPESSGGTAGEAGTTGQPPSEPPNSTAPPSGGSP